MVKVEVEVLSGDDLIIADSKSSDPYVKVFVYDKAGVEVLRKETEVVKKTLQPTWNWRGAVETDGVSRIRFEVWDHDMVSRNDFMGLMEVQGNELCDLNHQQVKRKLIPLPEGAANGGDARKEWIKRGESRGLGTLTVSWSIPGLEKPKVEIPVASPSPSERESQSTASFASSMVSKRKSVVTATPHEGPKYLTIRPLVVTKLPGDYHKRGLMSVLIEQKGRKDLKQSVVGETNARGDINWTRSMSFDIKHTDVEVSFDVIDHDEDGEENPRCTGSLVIEYGELKDMTEGSLLKVPLPYLVSDTEGDAEEEDKTTPNEALLSLEATWGPMPVSVGGSPAASRVETMRSKRESVKLPEPRIPETFTLTIIKAANLIKMDTFGKSDPYVVVRVDNSKKGETYETKVINKTLDPVWEEEFEVDIDKEATSWAVHMNVYDRDYGMKDDWMGCAVLHLTRDHLLKSIDSMCEWTLDLMGRPETEHQAEDSKFIEKHGGKIGSINVGLRSQDPPYPEMTRVKIESGACGFVKQYLGTSAIDGDQVQMYLVTMDEGSDERYPRTILELLGDIDDDETTRNEFIARVERQNETFNSFMQNKDNEFFETNELYFNKQKHPHLTREEKTLQKHYISYGDAISQLTSKFNFTLNKHKVKYITLYSECDTPQKRLKVFEEETVIRGKLVENWERERNKLQEKTALSVVKVTSAKLVVTSIQKLHDEASSVYLVVHHGGEADRATSVTKLVKGEAGLGSSDFPSGRQQSTHFGGLEPGAEGKLVKLELKDADTAPPGSQPTEEMIQTNRTICTAQVEVPPNYVTKESDGKPIICDLGWVPLLQEDGEKEGKAGLRLKLIMEVTGHEKRALEEKAAAQAELARQEEEREKELKEEEAREIPSLLDVEVVKGKNLIIQDFFSSDPYCIVEVLGGWSDAPVAYHNTTQYKPSTLEPKWNEKFTFDIFSLLEPKSTTPEDQRVKLRFTVWDKDTNGDDFMGYAEVLLEKEEMKNMITRRRTFTLSLEKRPSVDSDTMRYDEKLWNKNNKYFGEIVVNTRTSQPKKFGSKTEQNVLAIVAEEGHDKEGKKEVSYSFTAEPGCLTVTSFGQEVRIANVTPNSAAAKVGLKEGFTVLSFNGTRMAEKNKEFNKLIADRKAVDLVVEHEGTRDITFKADMKKDVVFMNLNECVVADEVREESDAHENGLRKGMTVIAANSKPVPDIDTLMKMLQHETTLTVHDEDGARISAGDMKLNLFVKIIKAKNLIRADSMFMRKSDPYVTAYAVDSDGTPLVGSRSKAGLPLRTPVVSNTLSPTWDFGFPSAVVLNEGERIRFDIWDDDTFGKDDFLGRAVLDPWDNAGNEEDAPTQAWLTLKHRGNREDSVAARHTAGEKPLGEMLVWLKASLVVAEDLGFGRAGSSVSLLSQSMTLDQRGKAYQKVRFRESITVTLSSARGLGSSLLDSKVYGLIKLQAPPAAGGRLRDYKTAIGNRDGETLEWKNENACLQFDDCGDELVEGFVLQLMKKTIIGSDDFIGKVAVSHKDEMWEENQLQPKWFELVPRTKKEKEKLQRSLGEVKLGWSFTHGEEQLVKKFEGKTFESVEQAAHEQSLAEQRDERRLTVYERMRGEGYSLALEVLSCEGLPKKGKVTVEVTCGGTTEKTDPSSKTDCPEWESACMYYKLECRNDGITVVVRTDDTPVGRCTFHPHEHHTLEDTRILPIFADNGDAAGIVNVQYTYHHVKGLGGFHPEFRGDATPPVPPKQQKYRLSGLLDQESAVNMTIVQAANLPGVDSGTLQPKVVLTYAAKDINVAEAKTARYPVFNEHYKLPLQAKGGATSETMGPEGCALFKVYDDNSLLSDQLVGTAEVDFVADYHDTMHVESKEAVTFKVNEEMQAEPTNPDVPFEFFKRTLTHINGKPVASAEQFKACEYPAEFSFERVKWIDLAPRRDESNRPHPDDAKLLKKFGSLGRVLVRWTHNMNIEKTAVEEEDEDEGEPMLHMTIYEGEKLIARDLLTSDPYVLVKYGQELSKTAYIKSKLNPYWGEELAPMPIMHGADVVELTCMDFDMANDDDFMGHHQFDPFAWVFGTESASVSRTKEGWVDLAPRELNKGDQDLYAKNSSSFGRLRIKVTLKGNLSKVEGAKMDISKSLAVERENEAVSIDQLKREGGRMSLWVDKAEGLRSEGFATCKLGVGGKEFVTQPSGAKTSSPSWLSGPYSVTFAKAGDSTKDSVYDIGFAVADGEKRLGHFIFNALEMDRAVGGKEVTLRGDDEDDSKPHGKLSFRWEIDFGAKDMAPWLDPEVRKDLKKWLTESESKLRITLTIVRCTNLKNVDTFGMSDPYVIASCGVKQTQTKVVSNNCNPVFNHEAQWDIDTFEQPIEFKIKDKELLGNDKDLGTCRLNLATISDEKGDDTLQIHPAPGMTDTSLGHLVLKYSIEKVQKNAVNVRFTVIEGKDLVDPNTVFKPTPKVLLHVGEGGGKMEMESKAAKGTAPSWMEHFEFAINTRSKLPVMLSVWEGDTCLGVYKQVYDFMGGDHEGNEWVSLQPRSENPDDALLESKHGSLGQVHVQWEVDTPEAREERAMRRELRLRQVYEANVLNMRVMRARNLPNWMMMSPQCRAMFPSTCDDQDVLKTSTQSSASPVWGMDCSWKLSNLLLNQEVQLQVWDMNVMKDKLVGTGRINVWENATDTKGERWVKLDDNGGEVFVTWSLSNEFAPSRMVLQLWLEKALDVVIPVEDAAKSSSDTASVYAVVELGPYSRQSEVVEAQKSTELLHTQTCSIAWGQVFEFDPIPITHRFVFHIWDKRTMSSDVCLGKVVWDWGSENDISDGAKHLQVESVGEEQDALVKKVASLGQLAVRWKTVNRQSSGIRDGQKVKCTVMKTRGIPQVDNPMRIYAVVTFGSVKEMSDATTNSELNHCSVFRAANEGQELRIEIWEKNYGLVSDTHIGYTTIAYGFDEEASGEEWLRLRPRQGIEEDYELSAQNDGNLGEVLVQWEWDSELFAGEGQKHRRQKRYQLEVKIMNAQNLTPQDTNGMSDPYIIVKHSDDEFKTAVKKNTLSPYWNETFVFSDCNVKWPVVFTTMDYDFESPDDFMGVCKLNIPQGKDEGTATLPLVIRKGNKSDVVLQEKYGGKLGTLSVGWKVVEVQEEEAAASEPVGIVTVSVLTAKVHAANRTCTVRVTVGDMSRETMKQQGQDLTWDREGIREQWKLPVADTDKGVLVEIIDNKTKNTLAARELPFEDIRDAQEMRRQLPLFKIKDGERVDGHSSGDIIDLEIHFSLLDTKDDTAQPTTVERWCKKCNIPLSGDHITCELCGHATVLLNDTQWRDTDTEWGGLSIGGVTQLDQMAGSVGQAAVKVGSKLFTFGGKMKAEYNPVMRQYDSQLNRWSVLEASCPHERYGATMVHHMNKLLVYGGFGPGGLDAGLTAMGGTVETASSFIEVGTDGDYWDDPKVALGDDVQGGKPSGYFDSVVEYDLATGNWRRMPAHGPGWDFRACHSAVIYKSKMIVYGGWSIFVKQAVYDATRRSTKLRKPNVKYSTIECRRGDVASYNVATGKWSWVKVVHGEPPVPRSHHTAVLKPSSCFMFVFGGVTAFSETPDDPDDTVEQSITYLNDLHVLDLRNKVWSLVPPTGDVPEPRAEHAATIHGPSLIVLGGRNGRRTFGEDSCYQFSFGPAVWQQISLKSSVSRSLSNKHEPERRKGRWGMCIAAFKPRASLASASTAQQSDLQKLVQGKREAQQARTQQLLRLVDDSTVQNSLVAVTSGTVAAAPAVPAKDVVFNLLVVGGCEKELRRGAHDDKTLHAAQHDTHGDFDEAHETLPDHRTLPEHGSHLGALHRESLAEVAQRGTEAVGLRRLRAPKVGVCAKGAVWHVVPSSFSAAVEGGDEVTDIRQQVSSINQSTLQALLETTWVDPGVGAAGPRRFIKGSGGAPPRRIQHKEDASLLKSPMKVDDGEMEEIIKRLGRKQRRPGSKPLYRPKKEPEPEMAKRSEEKIKQSTEMLSKGHSVGKARRRFVAQGALPGQVVKLKSALVVSGRQYISGSPGVVQEDPKSRKGFLYVRFTGAKEPVYVESEQVRLPTSTPHKPKEKKAARSHTKTSIALASTSPPRQYIFPDQWLEDDGAVSSD